MMFMVQARSGNRMGGGKANSAGYFHRVPQTQGYSRIVAFLLMELPRDRAAPDRTELTEIAPEQSTK